MSRFLLAWELGGGLGHTIRFKRLTIELEKRGEAVSVALPHSYHANQLGLDPSRIHMVPEWPGLGRGRANPMEPSAITHGEMLASTIFGPEEEIASHVGAWRDVFARAKPDVVIADYAPGAVLAARGHLPLVNIGDGYTLPPADLANFPRLWPGGGELLHDEAEMARRKIRA